MDAPVVSIALPVFRPDPRFFRLAVESLLSQSFRDLEVVIVEDPSPQSGSEILAGIDDPRLRHVLNPVRTSLPVQHNTAVSLCRGRFICRFDADDLCEPERVAREVEFLNEHPDISVVGSCLRVIDESGATLGFRDYPLTPESIRRTARRWNPMANPTVMFRREIVERFGGWRTDSALPAQDYEWHSRLLSGGVRIANLPDYLVRYRIHPGAMKATQLRNTLRSTIEIKQDYWLREMDGVDRAVLAGERLLRWVPPSIVLAAFKALRVRRRAASGGRL